ncbi:MAG: methyltransferase domain-containing protein [bacterium]|nr:methyltransferase domain-containing protein [bacterium]
MKDKSFRQIPLQKSSKRGTLGPVENLEQYVPSDWWRKIFDSFYIKTDSDVVGDDNITKAEVSKILEKLGMETSISKDVMILDLCCGQGRHALELARRGFIFVEGLDRSHYLIERAKKQAKKEGLPVKFREGDARKIPYKSDQFDVVMILGNSFGYFESDEDDKRVLKEVFRVLKPDGKIVIDITDGEYMRQNFQPRSWEWIDKKSIVCRERSLSSDSKRIISREVIIHSEKGILVDRFYAERLYSTDEIKEMLEEIGFTEIDIERIQGLSTRGQDLGMMERRFFITAKANKLWTKTNGHSSTLKNIVVILGDPKKKDPIKPGGTFDEDDIYTINKLKEALNEIKEYNFYYVSDHDKLIDTLREIKNKGKVDLVLNLCDEGFGNDPTKELHIPALLETLGIPYTGAGPQCLSFCYDKSLVRGIAKEMGIPVPPAFFIKPSDIIYEIPFSFPAIVKPNFGDSSFGITAKSVVYSVEELTAQISEVRNKFGYEKPILVEKFLPGKDLTLGIIGNPPSDYIVLPIGEEDYTDLPEGLPRICGYEAKWLPDSPYWNLRTIKAELPDEVERIIIECSLKLFERLGCRDYARFDWRLDEEGNPYLLEVNPNPGWCWDGHLSKLCSLVEISYSQMLALIIKAAEKRLKLYQQPEILV